MLCLVIVTCALGSSVLGQEQTANSPAPQPNATLSPGGLTKQPLAPGYYFLLKRVAAKTDTGVIAFRAGTQVYLIREEEDGEHCKVKADETEFTVSRFDITKNAGLAGKYAVPRQKVEIQRRSESQQVKGFQATRAKAQKIVLHSVEFHDAALREVVAYLNEQARQSDPNGGGVTVNLELPDAAQIPPITLSLHDVTLMQAVRAIAQQTNLGLRSENYGLVLFR